MIVYATLTHDSPRRNDWIKVFGICRVRLVSTESHPTILPGLDEPRPCYYANIDHLNDRQFHSVRHVIADRFFGGDQVRANSVIESAHGLPILGGPDLVVTVEAQFYL